MKIFGRHVALVTIFLCSVPGWSSPVRSATPKEDVRQTARGAVEELYRLVTFESGTTPDWGRVRSLFAGEAVVVLRTGRDEMTTFSVDGFVNDFVKFIEQSEVEKTGFTERILRLKSTVYGDIAHILVLFDSHINGSASPARQGIDSFQLIRAAGTWRIISITNDRPSPGNPIPDELF